MSSYTFKILTNTQNKSIKQILNKKNKKNLKIPNIITDAYFTSIFEC